MQTADHVYKTFHYFGPHALHLPIIMLKFVFYISSTELLELQPVYSNRVCMCRSSFIFFTGISNIKCIEIPRPICILSFTSWISKHCILIPKQVLSALYNTLELDICHFYQYYYTKRYLAFDIELNSMLKMNLHETMELHDETYIPYYIPISY